ncbi:hypothetical protein R1flu_003995 [Riccia fluitans]|uniref:Uncharacterized protein n=1 Tax=Riccia fluitans TaxID=41844 RepID=A0ABD1YP16_9MARC
MDKSSGSRKDRVRSEKTVLGDWISLGLRERREDSHMLSNRGSSECPNNLMRENFRLREVSVRRKNVWE